MISRLVRDDSGFSALRLAKDINGQVRDSLAGYDFVMEYGRRVRS